MIIAVSMRVGACAPHGEARDAVSHDWIRFLDRFEVTPLLVPNGWADPRRHLERIEISGLLLTNGNDVGRQPGETWTPSESVAEVRDSTERALLSYAVRRQIPFIGVCRGMQFINAYLGGTLVRDVAGWTGGKSHAGVVHSVTIVDPDYRRRLGAEACSTNSFHDQGVTLRTLASGLQPIAVSETGIVEGFYHITLPVLGIQWHLERRGPDSHVGDELFRQWLGWCAEYSGASRTSPGA